MDDIALRGLQETLLFPHVIHDMIAPDAQGERFVRQPEERQYDIRFRFIQWRKHQHQRCKVRRARKVQTTVAGTALQLVFAHVAAALVPLVHGHPAHRLCCPLVQAQLAEHILVSRSLQRLVEGVAHLVNGDRVSEAGVGLVPVFFFVPVLTLGQTVDHRIESLVLLPAFQDVQRFLMNLPADRRPVRPRRGKEEPERLTAGVAGALGHDVVQSTGRLGMQLVEDAG